MFAIRQFVGDDQSDRRGCCRCVPEWIRGQLLLLLFEREIECLFVGLDCVVGFAGLFEAAAQLECTLQSNLRQYRLFDQTGIQGDSSTELVALRGVRAQYKQRIRDPAGGDFSENSGRAQLLGPAVKFQCRIEFAEFEGQRTCQQRGVSRRRSARIFAEQITQYTQRFVAGTAGGGDFCP